MSNARSDEPLQGLVFHHKTITPAQALARCAPSTAYLPGQPVTGLDGKPRQQVKPAKRRDVQISSSAPNTD